MSEQNPLVGVLMGSQSDWPVMQNAATTLESLAIPCEARVISAHRRPERLTEYVSTAKDRGIRVLIAGAGMAAALPGVVAAQTRLPVIGVPLEGSAVNGLDALYSIVQMPPGVPVGTTAIGKPGAVNAALLAGRILALSDETIAEALEEHWAGQQAKGSEIPGE